MRVSAPRPSWMSGRWWTRLSTCPTKSAVTRNRVTSRSTPRSPSAASAAPATATPASSEASTRPARRSMRASTTSTASNFRCTRAERSARRRIANDCPRLVRRSSRAATDSSNAAAWSVHAISSMTLRRAISPSIGRTMNHATAPRTDREQDPGRPPGQARDDPHRQHADDGASRAPQLAAHERADGVRVVVDAVEHLADRLLRERGERLVQRRGEEVAAQAALGAVDHARPHHLADGVEQRRADDARGEELERRRRRVLGEPPGDDRAQRGTDRAHGEREQRDDGLRPAQPAPVQAAGRVGRARGAGRRRGVRVGRGFVGCSVGREASIMAPRPYGDPPRRRRDFRSPRPLPGPGRSAAGSLGTRAAAVRIRPGRAPRRPDAPPGAPRPTRRCARARSPRAPGPGRSPTTRRARPPGTTR